AQRSPYSGGAPAAEWQCVSLFLTIPALDEFDRRRTIRKPAFELLVLDGRQNLLEQGPGKEAHRNQICSGNQRNWRNVIWSPEVKQSDRKCVVFKTATGC